MKGKKLNPGYALAKRLYGKKPRVLSNVEAAASDAKLYGFVELFRVSVPLFFVLHFHHKFFGAVLLRLSVLCSDNI